MPLEKRCIKPGCGGYPTFGSGLPSSNRMRWACRLHRQLIEIGAASAPGVGGPGEVSALSPPAPPVVQGRLF